MRSKDRLDAARMLVQALEKCRDAYSLVLAIPRDAAPMNALIVSALDGQLDVVLVRKFSASFDPELAIGPVEEGGRSYIAPYTGCVGADTTYLEQESTRQMEVTRWRRVLYTPNRGPYDAGERAVVVVDGGLATRTSVKVVLHAIRERHPQHPVYAAPMAAPDSLEGICPLVDKIVCLYAPQGLRTVGTYYAGFLQVEDAEVRTVLGAASQTERRAG